MKTTLICISFASLLVTGVLAQKQVPSDAKFLKQAAKKTTNMSNLKQLAVAAMIYMSDNNDLTPSAKNQKTIESQLMPYIKNKFMFLSTHEKGGKFQYNFSIAAKDSKLFSDQAAVWLFVDPNIWPGNLHCVAFLDGHVKYISDADWKKAKSTKPKMVKPATKKRGK
jgi:hypothetical protein